MDTAAYLAGEGKEANGRKSQGQEQPLEHKGHLQAEGANDQGNQPEPHEIESKETRHYKGIDHLAGDEDLAVEETVAEHPVED